MSGLPLNLSVGGSGANVLALIPTLSGGPVDPAFRDAFQARLMQLPSTVTAGQNTAYAAEPLASAALLLSAAEQDAVQENASPSPAPTDGLKGWRSGTPAESLSAGKDVLRSATSLVTDEPAAEFNEADASFRPAHQSAHPGRHSEVEKLGSETQVSMGNFSYGGRRSDTFEAASAGSSGESAQLEEFAESVKLKQAEASYGTGSQSARPAHVHQLEKLVAESPVATGGASHAAKLAATLANAPTRPRPDVQPQASITLSRASFDQAASENIAAGDRASSRSVLGSGSPVSLGNDAPSGDGLAAQTANIDPQSDSAPSRVDHWAQRADTAAGSPVARLPVTQALLENGAPVGVSPLTAQGNVVTPNSQGAGLGQQSVSASNLHQVAAPNREGLTKVASESLPPRADAGLSQLAKVSSEANTLGVDIKPPERLNESAQSGPGSADLPVALRKPVPTEAPVTFPRSAGGPAMEPDPRAQVTQALKPNLAPAHTAVVASAPSAELQTLETKAPEMAKLVPRVAGRPTETAAVMTAERRSLEQRWGSNEAGSIRLSEPRSELRTAVQIPAQHAAQLPRDVLAKPPINVPQGQSSIEAMNVTALDSARTDLVAESVPFDGEEQAASRSALAATEATPAPRDGDVRGNLHAALNHLGVSAHQESATPAARLSQSHSPVPTTMRTDLPEWQAQFGQTLVRMAVQGQQRAVLQLHPAELGSVMAELQIQNGELQLQLTAASGAARHLMEQALPQLRDNLLQQGVMLAQADVQDAPSFAQSGTGHHQGENQSMAAQRSALLQGSVADNDEQPTQTSTELRRGLVEGHVDMLV